MKKIFVLFLLIILFRLPLVAVCEKFKDEKKEL